MTIEPYFQGTLYSLETISWQGRTRLLGVTSRQMSDEPYFREDAVSFPVMFTDKQRLDIEHWIENVLQTMNYDTGFAHTEFMITSQGYEVIEINPRLGGGLIGEMLCRTFDLNIFRAIIQMSIGMTPELLCKDLIHHTGQALFLIYAQKTGIYNSITIDKKFQRLPGAPEFFSTIPDGHEIQYLGEYRSLLGIILAHGETSEIALLNVHAAANKLKSYVKDPEKVKV